MTDVEFMMKNFGLSEEHAKMAIANGFKAGALMDGSARKWISEESGIGSGLTDAATLVSTVTKSAESKK